MVDEKLKVCYHANCNDGFCAAWLVHQVAPGSEFHPISYGDCLPDHMIGQNVYLVDFSFKRNYLLELLNQGTKITIFDHHVSAVRELEGLTHDNLVMFLDTAKSGARIVQQVLSLPAHWLVDYTEDRDLWRHELLDTHEVYLGLCQFPYDFNVWSDLDLAEVRRYGHIIRPYERKLIQETKKYAQLGLINSVPVTVVNNTHKGITSDLAGELAEQTGIGACFTVTPTGEYIYSLRSRGTFDVTTIAESFGGGGHKAAAGFKTQGPVHVCQ